jgi:Arc/MetJ-type ribon-helix-helix transcriptional regulator
MKKCLSVTVEEDVVKWIDEQVKTLRFRNRSHLVELALMTFMESIRKISLGPDPKKE